MRMLRIMLDYVSMLDFFIKGGPFGQKMKFFKVDFFDLKLSDMIISDQIMMYLYHI